MKLIRQTMVLVFVALMIQCLFFGCSSTLSKPSNSEIKQALTENPSASPVDQIDSIEVKEWGNFNKEGKYWPVKIRFVGSKKSRTGMIPADEVSELKLQKDDYGKWRISYW